MIFYLIGNIYIKMINILKPFSVLLIHSMRIAAFP